MTSPALNVAAEERGTGPVLLCIHGWAASRFFWKEVWERLGDRYRIVAVDLPGFGESEKPDAAYTMEYYAGILGALAARYGASLVAAHSMGGMVAAKWATSRPQGLRGLALVNAPVAGPEAFYWKTRFMLLPGIRWIAFHLCRMKWFRRRIARDFVFETPLPESLLDGMLQPTYASAVRSLKSMRATDLRGDLEKIAARTLVVATEHDRIIRHEQFDLAARSIPGATLVRIGRCGHVPMVERPAEFVAALSSFLDSLA